MRVPPAAAGGFSLIEALVAGGILAVGVLALAHVLVVAARATDAAAATTAASLLAAEKVEELRARPPSAPASGTEQRGAFTRRWAVVPDAADPAGTLVIRVSVTPGEVSLVTLRTTAAGP